MAMAGGEWLCPESPERGAVSRSAFELQPAPEKVFAALPGKSL